MHCKLSKTSDESARPVVVPPLQVRVSTRRLEAGAAADPAQHPGYLGLLERIGFAILPDESNGPGRLGQATLGAHAPGLSVVGRQWHTTLGGDGDGRCFAVVDQPGEFHVRWDLVGREVDDLAVLAVFCSAAESLRLPTSPAACLVTRNMRPASRAICSIGPAATRLIVTHA